MGKQKVLAAEASKLTASAHVVKKFIAVYTLCTIIVI